jgi:uncharacterized protein YqjF (DUF2071 family)
VQHDFNYRILEDVRHRPWPLPDAPWIMTQTWHDLLFAHWAVDPALVRAKVPSPLEIDRFDDHAWIGIVPFHMTNVAPRGLPVLPWVSAFPELNVRTYVRYADKRGVYFFSLDAANLLAVLAARLLFGLPYYAAIMSVKEQRGAIEYSSRRSAAGATNAELVAAYRPTGPVFHAAPGSIEAFLIERYCLYSARKEGLYRVRIFHDPWPLQAARLSSFRSTMLEAQGLPSPEEEPLLHQQAEPLRVRIWPKMRLR